MGATAAIGATGLISAGSALSQGQAQKAQADFSAGQYRINSQIEQFQAQETKEQGDIAAGQAAEKGRQEVAQQRVDAAATGANVNSGSALELQSDTNWQANQNQIMIRNNAWKQAWGLGVQSTEAETQAEFAEMAGQNAQNNSYLTAGMSLFGAGASGYSTYEKYNG